MLDLIIRISEITREDELGFSVLAVHLEGTFIPGFPEIDELL